jgi:hypothetical protein
MPMKACAGVKKHFDDSNGKGHPADRGRFPYTRCAAKIWKAGGFEN